MTLKNEIRFQVLNL